MQPGGELEQAKPDQQAENQRLQERVEELTQATTRLESEVAKLQRKNEQLQKVIDDLQGGQTVQLTHRNILYSEEKTKKRLPILREPVRGAAEVGSLVFGECFAVRDQREQGQDLWLQIRGSDDAERWVLGRDADNVNCVDMTQYDREKYRTRIKSGEYSGQDFPKKMYTEGFAGSNNNNICLISASGDSFWREINIEMLLRGIATATVFEEAWGGDETFTDWVAYYAVNCVQYGQLRTHLQKRLLVTVKPTNRWREYQAECCRGPDLDKLRHNIGKAQYKECSWLKGMGDQLHVAWEEVEFLTGFAFLRTHCAWTPDDCKRAANERFVWVLEEFFAGGYSERASYELECAHWLWDEAFDGCAFEEAARAKAYTELQQVARVGGARLEMPRSVHAGGTAPLAWAELAAAAAALAAALGGMDGAGRLAAGAYHSVSLDASSMLRAWGHGGWGECSAPTLASGESWAAVSAGCGHTLALTSVGALHTLGSDRLGQCIAPALAPDERWVAVSAGESHSLGLTAAGTLHAWGSNNKGQCAVPVLPPGVRWAAASAGASHSLGLTDAGELHVWGHDGSGQGNHPPVLSPSERWVAISAGYCFSLGLTAAGELHAWGANNMGQCSVPALAPGECWVAASAGLDHSLGLTTAGRLSAWGSRAYGKCKVPAGERWLAVSAGREHSLGLTAAGKVRAWGRDDYGQVSRAP